MLVKFIMRISANWLRGTFASIKMKWYRLLMFLDLLLDLSKFERIFTCLGSTVILTSL